MPDSDRWTQGQRVKPIPGDLDNFFAWAQDTELAEGPVKETLLLIQRNFRRRFEPVFRRRHEDANPGEAKESLGNRIRRGQKAIEDIGALEEAFARTLQFLNKDYELAIVKRDNGPAYADRRNTILIANVRRIWESGLEADKRQLRKLKDHKKPASAQTMLLRAVADFLFRIGCGPAHARDVTRLLICHASKTGEWPKGEKLAKEHRALMDSYGAPRRRRPRAGRK